MAKSIYFWQTVLKRPNGNLGCSVVDQEYVDVVIIVANFAVLKTVVYQRYGLA
jgi:hypothetical protein